MSIRVRRSCSVSLVAAVLCSSFAFAGCGGDDEGSSPAAGVGGAGTGGSGGKGGKGGKGGTAESGAGGEDDRGAGGQDDNGAGGEDASGTGGAAGGDAGAGGSATSGGAGGEAGKGGTDGGGSTSKCSTSFAAPETLKVNSLTPFNCDLPDPLTDANYLKFSGSKGQAVAVLTEALGGDLYNTTIVDTVVTLLDESGSPIAQNSNAYPLDTWDARLYTVLPYTGDYIVKVQECNAVFQGWCSPVENLTTFDYDIYVAVANPASAAVAEASATNQDAGTADGFQYVTMDTHDITFLSILYGEFESNTDVDVFSFTAPADLEVQGRETAYFYVEPMGPAGNGSTTSVGKMRLVSAGDLLVQAECDQSLGGEFRAPVSPGSDYYLFVPRGSGPVGSNDFHLTRTRVTGSYDVEAANVSNDLPATPELLLNNPGPADLAAYFVSGNLASAADIDFYSVPVPAAATLAELRCLGEAVGSGLRQFTASLTTTDGTTLIEPSATGIETLTEGIYFVNLPVEENTSALLRLEGDQDATVVGTYYDCAVYYY